MARGADVMMPRPAVAGEAALRKLQAATGLISRGWIWIQARKSARVSSRRLQVVETVSLGEKRFVAVVQVGDRQLLIGGSAGGVCLLTELGEGGRASLDTRLSRKSAAKMGHPDSCLNVCSGSFSAAMAKAKKPGASRARNQVEA